MLPDPIDRLRFQAAAAALVEARRSGQRIAALPAESAPASEAEAYRVQEAYVEAMQAACAAGAVVGYKVGCTNATAQAQLGLSAPFSGVLLEGFVRRSPVDLDAGTCFMCMIEAEIAFRLARNLAPGDAPFDGAAVRAAIGAVMPALEIVDSRYLDWTTAGAHALIADNGCTGFWVHGDGPADPSGIDLENHGVTVIRNGVAAETGNSANVLGSPLNALAWLANHLAGRGITLAAGHLVTTGTLIEVNEATAGDEIVAEFGSLGRVELRLN